MVDRFASRPQARNRRLPARWLLLVLVLLAAAGCGAPAARQPGASPAMPAAAAASTPVAAAARPSSTITVPAAGASEVKPGAKAQATQAGTAAPRAATAKPAAVRPSSKPAAGSQPPAGLALATPRPGDHTPTVSYGKLPPEAHTTLALIASDGPFPYRQDGVVFQNREGLLPRHSDGYYHEYTVATPGSPDRGARRIIAGGPGEFYYTGDHYASFRRVVP